jgi:DNA topoisomerase IB
MNNLQVDEQFSDSAAAAGLRYVTDASPGLSRRRAGRGFVFIKELGPANSERQAKKNIATAVNSAAELLGNTPAVCRKCYIHPDLLDAYMDGSMEARCVVGASRKSPRLTSEEAAVLTLLKRRPVRKIERKRAA